MRLFRPPGGLLALLTTLLLASCGTEQAEVPFEVGDPEAGGTAVVAVTSDFQVFNPVANTALVTAEVINFMLFTPLVQFDDDFDAVPALAESWDLDDAGVTFRLRGDIRWHDGQPVTADDVLFTFELAKNEQTASLLESAYLTMVESARVIDPQTIRFEFVAPHSQPLQGFWWAPLPRHLLGDVAPAQLAQAPYNRQPVGNGPFRFASWTPQQQVVFEANHDYPEALGGRPLLDRVVFRIVPEATTRLTEIITGAIDVNHTLLPDEARQIEGQRTVSLVRFAGRNFLYVGWNNEREPFRDARVRQALTMGIDRQGLIDALMYGHGEVAAGMIPSWSPVDPGVDPLPFDPDGARQLLQEAGWSPGTDGIMRREGQPLRFTLLTSEDRLRQDLAVVIQQQLRQIGADVQVRASEFQTLLQQHRDRDYDAVLTLWSLDSFRVDPSPLFSCEEAGRIGSPNRAGYCNPDADRLIEAGLRETNDARASDIWGEFSRLLLRDQPITFLAWEEQMAAVHQRLQGVEMDARGKLLSAPRWWIPPAQRR
jgi:peptide/nickel transport system substrate-binding protein